MAGISISGMADIDMSDMTGIDRVDIIRFEFGHMEYVWDLKRSVAFRELNRFGLPHET